MLLLIASLSVYIARPIRIAGTMLNSFIKRNNDSGIVNKEYFNKEINMGLTEESKKKGERMKADPKEGCIKKHESTNHGKLKV